jgi:divinyl protochlorophyllide a 8-vinyl-reductase
MASLSSRTPVGPERLNESVGRIGPNAITQLQTALLHQLGAGPAAAIFASAALSDAFDEPPGEMVDEADVARLHRQVRRSCTPAQARAIMHEAGDRTGQYILAHRIPAIIALTLRWLPAAASSRLLMRAIARHAWTFAGSGEFRIGFQHGHRHRLEAVIRNNPVVAFEQHPMPICDWHAAVFQRLFRELVSPATVVRETRCCAAGDKSCRFRIDLSER